MLHLIISSLTSLILYSNSIFKYLLNLIPIHPSLYYFLIPPAITENGGMEKVLEYMKLGYFPTFDNLAPSFTVFIILCLCRLICQLYIFRPFALYCMNIEIINIPLYVTNNYLNLTDKEKISYNKIQLNNNKIELKIKKFNEALWRFVFYSIFTILGYYVLFTPTISIWISNNDELWINWPFHITTNTMKLYYYIEMGSYLHQLVWTEVSRSDSLEMIFHHLITLILITMSFLLNFTRIGTAIMLIHDFADIWLEIAKVFNYTANGKGRSKWYKVITDLLFGIFTISFFITRLVIYPRYVLVSLFTTALEMFGIDFIGAYIWIFLLVSLQLLHIFWFYLIMKMVIRILTVGVSKDERSDDEAELDEIEESEKIFMKKKKN